MDLFKAIKELLEEKEKLNLVIDHLEALSRQQTGKDVPELTRESLLRRRRGRKGMNETERAEVSRRMKEYWAKRRKSTVNPS